MSMPEKTTYPDFIGLGASRNGTTWLHDALSEHPEIKMPSVSKEPHYFSWNHDKGLEWYSSNFIKTQSERIAGEISTHYYHNIEAMKRIHSACPEAKLILVCREQSDWMQSFYMFENDQNEHKTFGDYLESNPRLWKMGDYSNHIENILSLGFDRCNLLIAFYDDLKSDNKIFYRNICSFIGVDPNFIPSNIGVKKNTVLFPKIRRVLEMTNMMWIKDVIKNSFLAGYIRGKAAASTTSSYVKLPDDIREEIKNYYRKSNLQLGELTSRKDLLWVK